MQIRPCVNKILRTKNVMQTHKLFRLNENADKKKLTIHSCKKYSYCVMLYDTLVSGAGLGVLSVTLRSGL